MTGQARTGHVGGGPRGGRRDVPRGTRPHEGAARRSPARGGACRDRAAVRARGPARPRSRPAGAWGAAGTATGRWAGVPRGTVDGGGRRRRRAGLREVPRGTRAAPSGPVVVVAGRARSQAGAGGASAAHLASSARLRPERGDGTASDRPRRVFHVERSHATSRAGARGAPAAGGADPLAAAPAAEGAARDVPLEPRRAVGLRGAVAVRARVGRGRERAASPSRRGGCSTWNAGRTVGSHAGGGGSPPRAGAVGSRSRLGSCTGLRSARRCGGPRHRATGRCSTWNAPDGGVPRRPQPPRVTRVEGPGAATRPPSGGARRPRRVPRGTP